MELNEVDVRILVSLERDGEKGASLTTLTRRLSVARILKNEKERSLKKLASEKLIQINVTSIPGVSGPSRTTLFITSSGKRIVAQVKSGGISINPRVGGNENTDKGSD